MTQINKQFIYPQLCCVLKILSRKLFRVSDVAHNWKHFKKHFSIVRFHATSLFTISVVNDSKLHARVVPGFICYWLQFPSSKLCGCACVSTSKRLPVHTKRFCWKCKDKSANIRRLDGLKFLCHYINQISDFKLIN